VYAVKGDEVEFDYILTDGSGAVNIFNDTLEIRINATGSATVVENMPLKMTDGRVAVTVTDAVAEQVEVTIESITGLDTTDKVIINFVDDESEIPA
jgi:hypothetical protein